MAEWIHPDGSIIKNTYQFNVQFRDPLYLGHNSTAILHFENLDLEKDGGSYKLHVFNDRCDQKQTFDVIVRSKWSVLSFRLCLIIIFFFTEPPVLYMRDTFVKTDENGIGMDLEIVGYPPSNITCSYKECPIVPGLTWPVFHKCQESQSVDSQLTQTSRTHQNAKIHYKPTQPGILTCDAKNRRGNVTESAKIHIQDSLKLIKTEQPQEVVEEDQVSISCFVSVYNFTGEIDFKRLDDKNILNIGKLIISYN